MTMLEKLKDGGFEGAQEIQQAHVVNRIRRMEPLRTIGIFRFHLSIASIHYLAPPKPRA